MTEHWFSRAQLLPRWEAESCWWPAAKFIVAGLRWCFFLLWLLCINNSSIFFWMMMVQIKWLVKFYILPLEARTVLWHSLQMALSFSLSLSLTPNKFQMPQCWPAHFLVYWDKPRALLHDFLMTVSRYSIKCSQYQYQYL